ncbi:MAG: T9SS type A sorting domain-containing protein [Bacteroidales bacterium]
MKKIYLPTLLMCLVILPSARLASQTIWDSNLITFTKEAYTDWNNPDNQDRITDNVWITRGNGLPIFNIAEEIYDFWGSSPADTRWAFGSISDGVENLLFDSWRLAISANPPAMVDQPMVLFLVTDSIYIDIKFTSWTSGADVGGGGFSYERATGDPSETFWTGDVITFTKANNADWTQAGNQDRITDNVWLTRADNQGLFNIAQEESFSGGLFGTVGGGSPYDTEWAFGSIADGVETLEFDYWGNAIGWSPPDMVDQNMVLHLISQNIYIDIKFTSWTSGGNGGGFSYERSTGTTSETLWTGDPITFTKENNADWTWEGNQDRITDRVWITRGDNQGIFNFWYQDFYQAEFITSPTGTKWAFGRTSDGVENLFFDFFLQTIEYNPPGMVDRDMVLWIMEDDLYIDIKFTAWTRGDEGGGGGFSYTRATEASTGVSDQEATLNRITCYPNPASGYIYLKRVDHSLPVQFNLYDLTGRNILTRMIQGNEPVPVNHLNKGLYFYRITEGDAEYSGTILLSK